MDRDSLVELLPHYAAMLLLVFLVLGIVRLLVGDLGFWIELVIIVAVVLVYRPVAQYLGVAPSIWGG